MKSIGIILIAPFVTMIGGRILIGCLDKDDPDQVGWCLLFFGICAVIGSFILFSIH